MSRERLLGLVAVLLLAAAGWWLSLNTEWAERSVPRPETGEARKNPLYATEQWLRQLGMEAGHRATLETLPPAGGRLVLLSDDWSLVPGRAERLHDWVMQGGHLVVIRDAGWSDSGLDDWVQVDQGQAPSQTDAPAGAASDRAAGTSDEDEDEDQEEDGDEEEQEEQASTPAPAAPAPAASSPAADFRRPVQQLVTDGLRSYASCDLFRADLRLRARPGVVPRWQLTQGRGAQVVRLAVGQGTVTAVNASEFGFSNHRALQCENPLVLGAVLQVQRGATVWFYVNEEREALVPWLWHSGWIAAVFGALALLATLWRRAVRFGPPLPAAPRLRRSIAEQVRGMGSYLHRHGSDALLAAQQRALDATAARRLAGYHRLPVHERAALIAQATGLPRADLLAALQARFCTRAELPPRLQLLESARRRLHSNHDERQPR